MAPRPGRWLARSIRARAAGQWAALAARADRLGRVSTRILRDEALGLRADLDRFLQLSDQRVSGSRAALNALQLPPGTDWRWRPDILAGRLPAPAMIAPESGQSLGGEIALWHDCGARALSLRQEISNAGTDLAPFGLRLEVFGFTGGYLALSMDLPPSALEGLTTSHILRLETTIGVERPINIFARVNIEHGPNIEHVQNYLGWFQPGQPGPWVSEFDLALADLNEKRLQKVWLDLVFEGPRMNEIRIRELILSRHLRAGM